MVELNHLRAKATALFEELSWPGPDDEAWQRTDLDRLLNKGFLSETAAHSINRHKSSVEDILTPQLPEKYAARVITESGRLVGMAVSEEAKMSGLSLSWVNPDDFPTDQEEMGLEELSRDPNRISAWHWRDCPGSLVLELPEGSRIELPVIIEETIRTEENGINLYAAPHLHFVTGESSEISVLWSFRSDSAPGSEQRSVVNAGITGQSGNNSRAYITLRQNLDDNAVFFSSNCFRVERDGYIGFVESHPGGSLVKTFSHVVLAGEGANAGLNGLYVAKEGQHKDIGILQDHVSPNATSNALYKGAVSGGGRTIFQGLINVYPKAVKTDAYLTNKNLILAEGARADSIPQLNILTDDVKCSHGSTTGKIDEGQLFYLQSRGYSPDEAVREITRGFLAEVIDGIHEVMIDILSEDIDAVLGKE